MPEQPPAKKRVPRPQLARIISGGQTGVDRGALEAAIALSIPHGGWCPRGRIAEDGVIPAKFQLQETESSRYHFRTERNIQEADGTLILFRNQLTGGTALTRTFAERQRKPHLCVELMTGTIASQVRAIRDWLLAQKIQVLNVAGPRESSVPGISLVTQGLLKEVLEIKRRSATYDVRQSEGVAR